MTNPTLKAKLVELSEAERLALLDQKTCNTEQTLEAWLDALGKLNRALVDAFRSGDLVTKEELEAAVEAEREACALIAHDKAYPKGLNLPRDMPDQKSLEIYQQIRARKEDLHAGS